MHQIVQTSCSNRIQQVQVAGRKRVQLLQGQKSARLDLILLIKTGDTKLTRRTMTSRNVATIRISLLAILFSISSTIGSPVSILA